MAETKRTPEVVDEILARMSEGEPLRQILRSDKERFPSHTIWGKWCRNDPDLLKRHQEARDAGFDAIAEDCLRIADTTTEGVEVTKDEKGGVTEKRGDMLGHRKLQIETRLKLLAKWDPRRYGDKLAIGGADDLPPLKTLTDEQLEARIATLRAQIDGKQG